MKMNFFNILFLVGFLCLGVFADDIKNNDQSAISDSERDDFWQDEYDVNWYQDEVKKLGIKSHEDTDLEFNVKEGNDNKEVLIKTPEDTKLESADNDKNEDKKKTFESDKGEEKQDYDSYQIEDNRSSMTRDDQNKNTDQEISDANENKTPGEIEKSKDLENWASEIKIELTETDLKRIDEVLKNRDVLRDIVGNEADSVEVEEVEGVETVDTKTDSMQNVQNDEAIDDSIDEENDFADIIAEPIAEPNQIIQDETKKILEEDKSDLNNKPEKTDTPTEHIVENIDNETAEAIFDDIGDDLKELFNFWDDLADIDDSGSEEDSKSVENKEEDSSNTVVAKPVSEQNAESPTDKQNNEHKSSANQEDEKDNLGTDLSSAELNDLMTRFAISHFEDIDIQSDDFDKNIAPIHMTLAVDQVIEVTSPNYPEDYPSNNIVDWIFSGAGKGIEFNITDFSVNGYSGDFMLVVPGGIDNAVDNGIVFSYTLNKDKNYVFLDVDKLFVRFESKSGVPSKGFKFTVRLLEHLQETAANTEEPELPIAEPSIQLEETLMMYLAGINPEQFLDKADKFRAIVADMAREFIEINGLEVGEKTTTEVTQIVSTSSCNVHWPDFGSCTSVRIGVPLVSQPGLDERQLREMWESLVLREPFSDRMRDLGITEFALPSGGSTMTVWLVISVGVVLSAAMLGFALWRWNCTEDYTRMTSFGESDTESVIKKGPLDLFPASRQTTMPPPPPIYDERYFEDSTRVDMGGFTNKSYVRHGDFLPVDSDDETLTADNRNFNSRPRLMFL